MRINFYLDSPQRFKDNKKAGTVFLFISVYNRRFKLSTGISLTVDKWNTQKQQVKKAHQRSTEINAYFNKIRSDAEKAYYQDLMQDGHSFDTLKSAIEKIIPNRDQKASPKKKESKSLIEAYEEYREVRKAEVSKGTILRFNTIFYHLQKYEELNKVTLRFDKINQAFFEKFKLYFLQEVKLTNTTLNRYVRSFKTFMNWSVSREYTDNLTFREFKTKTEKAIIIYLTREELTQLYQLDLSNHKSLEKARDVFCFGCFTGQRFSDVRQLKREFIKGHEWHLRTQKTKDIILVPLTAPALAILHKYKNDNKPLPIMTNQRTNVYLKEACKLAGIDEPIVKVRYRGAERIEIKEPKYNFMGTHVARKTFVTLSMEAGMTHPEIMAITGHKDLKTLQKYSGQSQKAIQTKMNQIWNKAEL